MASEVIPNGTRVQVTPNTIGPFRGFVEDHSGGSYAVRRDDGTRARWPAHKIAPTEKAQLKLDLASAHAALKMSGERIDHLQGEVDRVLNENAEILGARDRAGYGVGPIPNGSRVAVTPLFSPVFTGKITSYSRESESYRIRRDDTGLEGTWEATKVMLTGDFEAKRQAEKVTELDSRLRAMAEMRDRSEAEVARLEGVSKSQAGRIEWLNRTLADCQARLQACTEQRDKLTAELEEEKLDHRRTHDTRNRENRHAQTNLDAAAEHAAELLANRDHWQAVATTAEGALAKENAQNERLRDGWSTNAQSWRVSRDKARAERDELAAKLAELESRKAISADPGSVLAATRRERDEAVGRENALSVDLEAARRELADAKASLKAERDAASRQGWVPLRDYEQRERALAAVRTNLNEYRGRFEDSERELQVARGELSRVTTECDMLRRTVTANQEKLKAVREALGAPFASPGAMFWEFSRYGVPPIIHPGSSRLINPDYI